MVFGLGGKKEGPKADKQPPPEATVAQAPSLGSLSKGDAQDPYAVDPVLSQMPRPSSLFEFGPLVQVGQNYMRGVCTGDDPDAIQACTWTIEEAQGKVKDKKHIYRVEF
jgi:hypothetical protein